MELEWIAVSSFAVVRMLYHAIKRICTRIGLGRARMATWHRGGWLKGLGIPAPTGSYEVGCVDLMHRLEGDSDGLLVRLFYPTDPGLAGRYQYARTIPDSRYLKGLLNFIMRNRLSVLIACLVKPFYG